MFNLETIEQLKTDVGADVLLQLLGIFQSETSKLVTQLIVIDPLDQDAERLSHSLKSCSRSYGADALADLAFQLESAAQTQSKNEFKLLVSQLSPLHEKMLVELNKLNESLTV